MMAWRPLFLTRILHHKKAKHSSFESAFWLEILEPKLLLSADLIGGSIDGGLLSVWDNEDGMLGAEEKLQWTYDLSTLLERRLTDDAFPTGADFDNLFSYFTDLDTDISEKHQGHLLADFVAATATSNQTSIELILVDPRTDNYLEMLQSVTHKEGVQYQVYVLDALQSGVTQISDILKEHQNLDAVHLITHGKNGELQLGTDWLSIDAIDEYQDQILEWRNAFDQNADILLYGCDIAASQRGEALVSKLASLTDTDVAASTNLTGGISLGGDWLLEYQVGEINSSTLSPNILWSHLLGPPGAVSGLWLSTAGDVVGSTTPGLGAWSDGELLEFSDPGFTFDPGATSGSFSSIVNLNAFNTLAVGGDNDVAVTAMHYVTTNITLGTGNTFDLRAGDILLATDEVETLSSTNTLTVGKEDLFVFRPDVANDYSSGSFYLVVENLASTGEYLTGISLVENTIGMGSRTLTAGSIIFSQINEAGGRNPNNIYHADIDQAGVVSGVTTRLLIDGDDIGISASFAGLELIENNVFIGGENISSGNILIAISTPDTVGDNNLAATAYDVIALNVTQTTDLDLLGIPILSAAATATLLFDGADVNFGGAGYEISALSLVASEIPAATHLNQTLAYTEGDAQVGLDDIVVTDVNVNEIITATLTLSDTSAGSITAGSFGATSSTYNAGTGLWSVTGTITDVNAALAAAAFVPVSDGDVNTSIITHIEDAAANAPANGVIALSVTPQNDAPAASNLNQIQGYTEGDASVALTDIVITDVDTVETVTATLTLLNTAAGALTVGTFGSASSIYNTNTGVWNISGSLADVNAALAAVAFIPNPNTDVNTTITTHIEDAAGTGPADGVINLNVNAVNDDPVLDGSISNQLATEDSSFSFSFAANTFSDVDTGDTLTYSAQLTGGGAIPGWLIFNSATRTFSGTPGNNDVGTISITVFADDGNGGTPASDTFTITISNTNDSPAGTVTIDGVLAEDQVLTANTSTLTDDDGLGVLSYQWFRDAAEVTGATGNTYTLGDNDVGASLSVQVTYTDLRGAMESVTSAGSALIANVNDTPTGSVTITGSSTFGATLTASNDLADIDGLGVISYQWQQNGTDIVGETGTTYLIVAGDIGNTLNVVATYTDGYSTVESISSNPTSTVTATNNSPTGGVTITGIPQEDTLLTADTTLLNDADGLGVFSYQWQQNGINIVGATGNTFTPGDAEVGVTLTVVVIYTDGLGTVENVVSSSSGPVVNINDAPSATELNQGHAYVEGDATVALCDIVISDVDAGETVTANLTLQNTTTGSLTTGTFGGVTSTYNAGTGLWSAVGSIADVNAALAAVAFLPTMNNDINTTITTHIEDLAGASPVDGSISLNVTGLNDNPILNAAIGNQQANEDAAFTFTFPSNTFLDIDSGDTLAYSATLIGGGQLPGWLSFDSATRTFSGTPSNTDVGSITIQVSASDGQGGLNATTNFTLVINNTNDDPFANGDIPNQVAVEDSAFDFTVPANTFLDIDSGAMLSYSAQLANGGPLPGWLSFDAATQTFSGTPTNDDVGTLLISVTASDNNGGTSAVLSFEIVVTNTNDDPQVSQPIPSQVATQNSPFNFSVDPNTFSDADNDTNSLSFSATLENGNPLPNWLTFDTETLSFSGTPTNEDVSVLTLSITADDGQGGTPAVASFELVVVNVNDVPILNNNVLDQTVTEDSLFSFTIPTNLFSDPDLDALSYSAQLSNGESLPAWLQFDASNNTLLGTPGNENVGTLNITILANDGQGGITQSNSFQLTVLNQNDAPEGNIVISGDKTPGQVLQAETSALLDQDGLGEFSFQWFRDGSPIIGATGSSYEVQLADMGRLLTVGVSYIDGFGTPENILSDSIDVPVVESQSDESLSDSTVDLSGPSLDNQPILPDTNLGNESVIIGPPASEPANDDDEFLDPALPEETQAGGIEDSAIDNDIFQDQVPIVLLNEVDNDHPQLELAESSTKLLASNVDTLASENEIVDLGETGNYVPFEDPLLLIQTSGFLNSLDDMQEDMKNKLARNQILVGSSLALSAGLSAGYIAWLARSGVLLSSVLSTLPAWRFIDPLPVLNQYGGASATDDESLESIVTEGLAHSAGMPEATQGQGEKNAS